MGENQTNITMEIRSTVLRDWSLITGMGGGGGGGGLQNGKIAGPTPFAPPPPRDRVKLCVSPPPPPISMAKTSSSRVKTISKLPPPSAWL